MFETALKQPPTTSNQITVDVAPTQILENDSSSVSWKLVILWDPTSVVKAFFAPAAMTPILP